MTKKTQILIVDDHPNNIKVLSDLLIAHEFEVVVAQDGENALQKLHRVSPDLILLDVLMPGIGGFATCQRLKAQESTQNIPVIFMTALTDTVDKIKGLTLGAVDYITKPLQPEEVIARVNVHLQLRSLNQHLVQQNALLQDEMRSRALAQTTQRLSEEKFGKIFRANPVAMAILNLESGRFLEINQSLSELTGYVSQDIVGKTMAELGFWYNSADRNQYFLSAPEPWDQVELPLRSRTGRIYHLLTSAKIIDLAQTRCLLLTAQDITHSKQTEAILHDREARLRAIFEQLAVGLCYFDLQGNLLQANQKYCNILGYTAAEIVQLTIEQITHPTDYALNQAKTQQLLAEKITSFSIEKRYLRKDNCSVWVNLTLSPIRDATGTIVMLGSIVEDINEWKQLATARQQAEAKLRQSEVNLRASEEQLQLVLEPARNAVEAANRAKSTFLANVNHELRTPLTIILGCSELLNLDANLTPQQKQRLASIDRSVYHLLNLINNVLELSKIEAGAAHLEITTVDLWQLLQNLTDRFLPQTIAKGLQLTIDRADDLPQFIQTDERKLNQILINLLSNAVKFTATGGVQLIVRGVGKSRNAVLTLNFTLEDTGEGIAAAELSAIFVAFGQTDTGRKSQKGTGLGLSLCRQLARLMAGDIIVQSEVGRGSRFSLILPVQLPAVPQLKARLPRSIEEQPLKQGNYRILVVEDTADMRENFAHILVVAGFKVRRAAHGKAAIAQWQDWHPHLILMDMRMPMMNGYAATRQIRAQEQVRQLSESADEIVTVIVPTRTVIIAVTANAFEEDRQAILAAGCDDIVDKPFKEADLIAVITQQLGIELTAASAIPQELAADLTSSMVANLASPSVADIPQLLAKMPSSWLLQLRRAALRLNADSCFQLLEQIPPSEAKLFQMLVDLLDNFRFDIMIDLISSSQILITTCYPVRSDD